MTQLYALLSEDPAALKFFRGAPELFNLARIGHDDAGRPIYGWPKDRASFMHGLFLDPEENHRYEFVPQPRRFLDRMECLHWLNKEGRA